MLLAYTIEGFRRLFGLFVPCFLSLTHLTIRHDVKQPEFVNERRIDLFREFQDEISNSFSGIVPDAAALLFCSIHFTLDAFDGTLEG